MSEEESVREHLLNLLKGRQAHLDHERALADFPRELRGQRPKGLPYSAWELLEHLRIAQWDILEFSRNAQHVSPQFPEGYWPKSPAPPDEKAWEDSQASFQEDLQAMADLVEAPTTDLFAPIPHGTGQTVLREALLVADHNAYHLGQLVLLRRFLGAWIEKHEP
ncbi:MAG: DinB family protein, partial [Acidobacteriota bacterium]